MSMYQLTGVVRPDPDIAGAITKADDYATVATAANTTWTASKQAVDAVLAVNNGPAASSFRTETTGAASIVQHFEDLNSAAQRTSQAYQSAALSAAGTKLAMDAVAIQSELVFRQTMKRGIDVPTLLQLVKLVQVTRTHLQRMESSGAAQIRSAFSQLALPTRFTARHQRGAVHPDIASHWTNPDLTDAERKAILQRIADDYADRNGYPRIQINFNNFGQAPGTRSWGSYTPPDGPLELNLENLRDPGILHTVVHEMEHRGQHQGMAGNTPMTPADAERWRELNSDDVRAKGGPTRADYYPPRPVEVGAREAGRDSVNNMTYEEYRKYL